MSVSQSPTPITLLLIEDDEIIAEPLIFGLQDAGFRVLHSTDGKEGITLARSASPDLILLEPVMDFRPSG